MPLPRPTRHVVIQAHSGQCFILSSLCTRVDTQLISIDPISGDLVYTSRAGVDLFRDEAAALKFLGDVLGQSVSKRYDGVALAGYVRSGSTGLLLLITKARTEALLPGGHPVFTVTEATWVHVPLRYSLGTPHPHQRRAAELLTAYRVSDLHFYCETYDMTRPFPSSHPVLDYDEEFSFNSWLATPFAAVGLREWCVVLVQGSAQGRVCQLSGTDVHVVLITRKSNLNAGTRYYARGLNESGGCGNEAETQQLLWYDPPAAGRAAAGPLGTDASTTRSLYASSLWRRGTVPLCWRGEIKSAVGEATTIVSERPFEYTPQYWKSVLRRYPGCAVTCVSLLKCDPDHTESALAQAYHHSVEQMAKLYRTPLRVVNFDWHKHSRMIGIPETVQALWATLAHNIAGGVTSAGEFVMPSLSQPAVAATRTTCTQGAVLRWNCADSVDRTNVAVCFFSLQIAAEHMRLLGLPSLPLPAKSGDAFPWLLRPLDAFLSAFPASVRQALAEMHVRTGDVLAELYTNTAAEMTAPLRALAPALPQAQYDTAIAVQRRYQNVYKDEERQMMFEAFLGVRGYRDVHRPPPHVLSAYPALVMDLLPHVHVEQPREATSLLRAPAVCWIMPPGGDSVTIRVWLPRRSRVTEVGLTIRYGTSDGTCPRLCTVAVGEAVHSLRTVVRDAELPRAPAGTFMLVPTWSNTAAPLFPFAAISRRTAPVGRVVSITLRGVPSNACMTLGQIVVLGFPEAPHITLSETLSRLRALNDVFATAPPQGDGPNDDASGGASTPGPMGRAAGTPTDQAPAAATPAQDPKALYRDFVLATLSGPAAAAVFAQGGQVDPRIPPASHELRARALSLGLTETLRLEAERLSLGLSAEARDRVLEEMGVGVGALDPNTRVVARNQGLEMLLRRAPPGQPCFSCRQPATSTCHHCRQSACGQCMSPQLLPILQFDWLSPLPVCHLCATELQEQQELLARIQSRLQQDRSGTEPVKRRTLTEEMRILAQHASVALVAMRPWRPTLEPEPILRISVVAAEPTAPWSVPLEATLLPEPVELPRVGWSTPEGDGSALITLALPHRSALTRVELVADEYGSEEMEMAVVLAVGETLDSIAPATEWTIPPLQPFGSHVFTVPAATAPSAAVAGRFVTLQFLATPARSTAAAAAAAGAPASPDRTPATPPRRGSVKLAAADAHRTRLAVSGDSLTGGSESPVLSPHVAPAVLDPVTDTVAEVDAVVEGTQVADAAAIRALVPPSSEPLPTPEGEAASVAAAVQAPPGTPPTDEAQDAGEAAMDAAAAALAAAVAAASSAPEPAARLSIAEAPHEPLTPAEAAAEECGRAPSDTVSDPDSVARATPAAAQGVDAPAFAAAAVAAADVTSTRRLSPHRVHFARLLLHGVPIGSPGSGTQPSAGQLRAVLEGRPAAHRTFLRPAWMQLQDGGRFLELGFAQPTILAGFEVLASALVECQGCVLHVWALQTDARREALAQKFLGSFAVPFCTPAPLLFEMPAPCPANSVWVELVRPEPPQPTAGPGAAPGGWSREAPMERLRFFTF